MSYSVDELVLAAMFMGKSASYKAIFDELDEKVELGEKVELNEKVEFEPSVDKRKKQFEGAYHLASGVVIARLRKDGIPYPVIMDEDIYEEYLADGKGGIFFTERRDGEQRPTICKRGGDRTYARIWQLAKNWKSKKGMCVDHIRNNVMINLHNELRICTLGENRRNSPTLGVFKESNPDADEFTYSLARDCSETLFAYVLMLLGVITEDKLAEVNKIVNSCRLMPKDSNKFVA